MKFIHVADVHLGAKPDAGSAYSPKRMQEIWNSFASVIEECRIQEIDALFIAGDLFHRQPLLRELKEVNYLFEQIPDTHIFIIAGNHDYLKRDSYYLTFAWGKNIHFLIDKKMTCVQVPELELAVYGCSYYTREILENVYDTATACKRQKYEVLLAHGGDDKHIPIKRNKIASLGYDYIALGHIHKPHTLVPDLALYAGALEPLDKNDVGKHGYILGEITEKGVKAFFVPCALREYIHAVIEVNETMTAYALKNSIAGKIESLGRENIFKMILTGFRDPQILFDLKDMDVLGNIIEISDNTKPAYDFQRLQEQNKDNLIGKFIENLAGSEKDSVEFGALCEGVQALMETRRG